MSPHRSIKIRDGSKSSLQVFDYFCLLDLSKLFLCGSLGRISAGEAAKESHSRMLSDKEVIYALHTHNIRADSREKYLDN